MEDIDAYMDSQPVLKPKRSISETARNARKANLEKGRQIRLARINQQRELEREVKKSGYKDDDSTSSEEDEIVYRMNTKSKAEKPSRKVSEEKNEIAELKQMIYALQQQTTPKPKKAKKTVYLERPPVEKVVEKIVEKPVLQKDMILDSMKMKILNF